jgi:hypothetical protein
MKSDEKSKARELRSQGLAIKQIARQLKVSPSSVSRWVVDVELTDEQKTALHDRLLETRARFGSVCHRNATIRKSRYRQEGFQRAATDPEFCVICALYWGEGSKTGSSFRIANCDPLLIKKTWVWLMSEGYYQRIRFSVYYHESNGIAPDILKKFWSDVLPGLKETHWAKCYKKQCNGRNVGKVPYGTAYVAVHSTELMQYVLGGIDYLGNYAISRHH